MALLCRSAFVNKNCRYFYLSHKFSTDFASKDQDGNEFTKLEIVSKNQRTRGQGRRSNKLPVLPPRYKQMQVDQHWPSVWPAAASFRPSVVPLPLHQGYNLKGPPPGKEANPELLKIPNFLHLTPPAVKAHCAAIKKYCTAWPAALREREGFPLEIITSDYCHSGPSIRDTKARIVTLKINLSDLKLDTRAREKMIRLVRDRYNKETDTLTLVADRCPTKKQNQEYLHYLLSALYHQSCKHEDWESDVREEDWLQFQWEGSRAQQRLMKILRASNQEAKDEDLLTEPSVKAFGEAMTALLNGGETKDTVRRYKETILPVFRLSPWHP